MAALFFVWKILTSVVNKKLNLTKTKAHDQSERVYLHYNGNYNISKI